jgi:hypothetical protein
VRAKSIHKDVEHDGGGEQRLGEKPHCLDYMMEEENSLQLILQEGE